jgi:type I restriction enzyme R subunit
MKSTVTESEVESAALTWLKSLGWQVKYGPDIAPDMQEAEHEDFIS